MSGSTIDLPLERSLYVGNFMRGILYGIELFTFAQAVHTILNQPPQTNHRGQTFYIYYGAVLITMVTIAVITDALWGEFMWIDHRDVSGGPLAYFEATTSMWMNVLGSAADATANIMGDGLLLYRCYMIWGSNLWVVVLPCCIYLASSGKFHVLLAESLLKPLPLVLVVITVVESALPGAFLLNGTAANFGVPWVSLSVSLNVILTAMICGRLLMMRRIVRSSLSFELGNTYTSIMAILVESALPFSVVGVGFVITYAKNSPTSDAFAYVWGMFCSLSPQLIILRVAMGRGWSRDTVQEVSRQIVFAHSQSIAEHGESQSTQVGMTILHDRSSSRSLRELKTDINSA
ncbi:hypothetical protein C8R41DRAFT_875766 [Lentinula lateritia]|uniref:Uncharacterized protein n=1 Tax=Lentinula lateritia TaxID=40482 RepID=A0ABQ8VTQ5_9AGAR|nr:hypothetical protein C8R41DRAFT_875766 [Lentinula lateritia]